MKPPPTRASLVPLLLATFLLAGCDAVSSSHGKPRAAVTSSYLESAIRDLVGDAVEIERLVEPGTCPGHFDVRPAQVRQLADCVALFRFDFQQSLDRQVEPVASLRVVAISATGGMNEPETYLDVCRQVGAALVQLGLLDDAALSAKRDVLTTRLKETLVADIESEIEQAGLGNAAVIASPHQSAFAKRIGLRVIATIGGSDNTSIRRIDDAIRLADAEGCRIVIANRPEGTQLAASLASRLGARMVVFDNFPAMTSQQPDFEAMVRQNVRALLDVGDK